MGANPVRRFVSFLQQGVFVFNPTETTNKAENSAILRVDTVQGIGSVLVFTDESARDAYGRYVVPEGFEDSGSFEEVLFDDHGDMVMDYKADPRGIDEYLEEPAMVTRYWGRK